MLKSDIPSGLLTALREGVAIPAIPLALDSSRRFDARRQRALVRYYLDAGSGGIAAGVHTTQFEIRDPKHGLFRPVLQSVSESVDQWCGKRGISALKVGGVCGPTAQAVGEAEFLVSAGFHAGLLSLAGHAEEDSALLGHVRAVADKIPVIGFYLQPAVGGRTLSYDFWRGLSEIDNVIAIKMAPFNRYATFDVVRAVSDSGREDLALYTGNDDNIVVDLLTEYSIRTADGPRRMRIVGGLLGHWSVWTRRAVELLARTKAIAASGGPIPRELLTLAQEVTDANAAVFDAAHGFAGCIPGIHEVLRRQGLLEGTWCLDPEEILSPGQAEELDRVTRAYPHLVDDDFVKARLAEWLE